MLTAKDIKRAKEKLAESSTAARPGLWQGYLIETVAAIEYFGLFLKQLTNEAKVFYEDSTGETPGPDFVPAARPRDSQMARVSRWGAVAATVGELVLASWSLVSLIWGVLSGLVAILVTDAFVFALVHRRHPREGVRLIRYCVLAPAAGAFGGGLFVFMAARYAEDQTVAAALGPCVPWALAALTLGCALGAAGLYALSHTFATMSTYQRQYAEITLFIALLQSFRGELEEQLKTWQAARDRQLRLAARQAELLARAKAKQHAAKANGNGHVPASPKAHGHQERPPILPMSSILLLAALPLLSRCASPSADAKSTQVVAVESVGVPCTVSVVVDQSGSLVGLQEAYPRLVSEELPEILREHPCQVNVVGFDVDGFGAWKTLGQVPYPTVAGSKPPTLSDKAAVMPSLAKAHVVALRQWQAEHDREQRQAVATMLSHQLPKQVQPATATPTSDIYGAMLRVSQSGAAGQHTVMLILTDLCDTTYGLHQWPRIPEPQADVTAVVLWLPTAPGDVLPMFGRPTSPATQFEVQRERLHAAAPWVTVVPAFRRGLAQLLTHAGNRS